MKTGVQIIADERMRQITVEGWTLQHDDAHDGGELAMAGACYAIPHEIRQMHIWDRVLIALLWPWEWRWFKPSAGRGLTSRSRIRELAKAGALIAAEIDRLQRSQNA